MCFVLYCASMLCAILCYQACIVLHYDVVHRATLCYNEFQCKQCAVCYMMNHAVLFAARKNKKSKDLNKIKHISQMTSLVLSEVQLEHCLSAVCKLCRLRGKERFTSAITGSEVAETGE